MSTKRLSFRGSQQNFYSVARLAWGYCQEYITEISAVKALYTTTYINAQLAKLNIAEGLPDYGNRKDIPKQAYVDMKAARLAVLDAWQLLKQYIMDAFSPEVLPTKLYAAGQIYYSAAERGSLDKTASLIRDAIKFMGSNETALLANDNMPVGFPASFATLGTAFNDIRSTYFGQEDIKNGLTGDKNKANEAVLATLMPMLKLANRRFVDDPEVRAKFTYARLLDRVRGHQPAGLEGLLTIAGTQTKLAGATIQAIGTEYSTVSDANGRYVLSMASGRYDIEVSAPGYQTVFVYDRKIDVGVKHRMNLAMEAVAAPVAMLTSEMLEDIVADKSNGVPAEPVAV